jgi:glycosyltransferase involved in cell wall biosynthesis
MNETRSNISIIIPTYDRLALLRRCVASVLRQRIEVDAVGYEIIVAVDQRDKQTTGQLTQETEGSARVRCVRASLPGANAARNAGIRAANGAILCFLDDDCLMPDDRWLMRAHTAFQRHKDAMGIGGGYIFKTGNDVYALCRNALDNFYLEHNAIGGNRTTALLGGASGYRKDVFQSYGYFDESILYGSAETEMNDRILQGGGKLYFLGELSIEHVPSKRTFVAYLYGSWLRGLGQAYSVIKNGRVKKPRLEAIPWWAAILKRVEVEGWRRFLAAGFLIALSVCYHWGLLFGLVRSSFIGHCRGHSNRHTGNNESNSAMGKKYLACVCVAASLLIGAVAFLPIHSTGALQPLYFSLFSEQKDTVTSVSVMFSSARDLSQITSVKLIPPVASGPLEFTASDLSRVPGLKKWYALPLKHGIPLPPGKYGLVLYYRNGEVLRQSIYWRYRRLVLPALIDYANGYISWDNDGSVVSYDIQFLDQKGHPVYGQIYCPVDNVCMLFLDQRKFIEGEKYFIRMKAYDVLLPPLRNGSEYYLAGNSAVSQEFSFTFKRAQADIVSWKVRSLAGEDTLDGVKKTMMVDARISDPYSVASVAAHNTRGKRWKAFYTAILSLFRINLMPETTPGGYMLSVRDASLRLREEKIQVPELPVLSPPRDMRYSRPLQALEWSLVSGAAQYRVDIYCENNLGQLRLTARRLTGEPRFSLDDIGAPGESLCAEVLALHRINRGKGEIIVMARSRKFYFIK